MRSSKFLKYQWIFASQTTRVLKRNLHDPILEGCSLPDHVSSAPRHCRRKKETRQHKKQSTFHSSPPQTRTVKIIPLFLCVHKNVFVRKAAAPHFAYSPASLPGPAPASALSNWSATHLSCRSALMFLTSRNSLSCPLTPVSNFADQMDFITQSIILEGFAKAHFT